MSKNDQTPVQPPEGEGEGQGQQDPQPTEELSTRLSGLQADLEKAQREARINQRRADRAEEKLNKVITEPKSTARSTPPNPRRVQSASPLGVAPRREPPPQEPRGLDEATREVVEEQQRELMLLREVARRGLTLSEVELLELDFQTATELRTQLDLYQQKLEIESLRESLAAEREAKAETPLEAPPSGPRVDTGGPTGTVDNKRVRQIEELDNTAKDLRGKRRHKEAVWVKLRALHKDPSKYVLLGPQDFEE